MPEADRFGELLAFDLALSGAHGRARSGAPLFFPPTAQRPCVLAGFDEAGRGALAGPIVVGCVCLSLDAASAADLGRVDDSKRLTERARAVALVAIDRCGAWAFGSASPREIDALGIVRAAEAAARRAYARLGRPCDLALFDRGLSMGGGPLPLDPGDWPSRSDAPPVNPRRPSAAEESRQGTRTEGPALPPGVAFTKGDTRSLHVAAASIVAKVTRDQLMCRLDLAFPGYGLASHKGYGTRAHRVAVARLGPSPIHRRSFHLVDEAKSQSC